MEGQRRDGHLACLSTEGLGEPMKLPAAGESSWDSPCPLVVSSRVVIAPLLKQPALGRRCGRADVFQKLIGNECLQGTNSPQLPFAKALISLHPKFRHSLEDEK